MRAKKENWGVKTKRKRLYLVLPKRFHQLARTSVDTSTSFLKKDPTTIHTPIYTYICINIGEKQKSWSLACIRQKKKVRGNSSALHSLPASPHSFHYIVSTILFLVNSLKAPPPTHTHTSWGVKIFHWTDELEIHWSTYDSKKKMLEKKNIYIHM